jgi:hypothetical protein
VPARFSGLSAVLEVLVGEARKRKPQPPIDGLYDLDAWRTLWEDALASPVTDADTPPQEDSAVCPYMGLSAFGPDDANWFFGRERATNALLSRLNENGITMLVGASGAGKSSLMKAGVLPRLGKDTIVISPGTDPLKELALQVPDLIHVLESAADSDALTEFAHEVQIAVGGRVVIIDQFEEAFTLGGDENRLRIFVQALHAAAEKTAVVLGVRADFYARCLDFPELAEALQTRQMVLGAMSAAEVRDAVTNPARATGLQLEAGLVDLMLRDLGTHNRRGKDAYDAGALPLLSHALLVTWQRRQAGRLTIAGYRAAGGIQGAVAATAERAWSDLDEPARAAAKQLLLRLVRVGDDTQDTRRRSSRHSLLEASTNLPATERALEVLTHARLITMDAGSVEITHEALLQAWPRLRSWIDEDRAGNLTRQRLEEDAASWSTHDRDSSLLYRGARLEGVRQQQNVTTIAKEFVRTSERQHRKSVWLRRSAVALVAVFALIAASAAVIAVRHAPGRPGRERQAARRPAGPAGRAARRAHRRGLPDDVQPRRHTAGHRQLRPHRETLGRQGSQPSQADRGHHGAHELAQLGRLLPRRQDPRDHRPGRHHPALGRDEPELSQGDQDDRDRQRPHLPARVQPGRHAARGGERGQVSATLGRPRPGERHTVRRTVARPHRRGPLAGVQPGRQDAGDDR